MVKLGPRAFEELGFMWLFKKRRGDLLAAA